MSGRRRRRTRITPNAATATVLLPVPYREQQKSNWCWAACCQMFLGYRKGPDSTLSQCEIATKRFGVASCALDCSTCNRGGEPKEAFQDFDITIKKYDGLLLRESKIKAELAEGRPVEVQYRLLGSARHVVMITGLYDDGEYHVLDPSAAYGVNKRSFKEVENASGLGFWDRLYTGLA